MQLDLRGSAFSQITLIPIFLVLQKENLVEEFFRIQRFEEHVDLLRIFHHN